MRQSAYDNIDRFFDWCEANSKNLTPESVVQKYRCLVSEEKREYFSNKLTAFIQTHRDFARRFIEWYKTKYVVTDEIEEEDEITSNHSNVHTIAKRNSMYDFLEGFQHSKRPRTQNKESEKPIFTGNKKLRDAQEWVWKQEQVQKEKRRPTLIYTPTGGQNKRRK